MKAERWARERIGYWRGLKKPTEQQHLLLLLIEKEDRESREERMLTALIKAERAAERAQAASANAVKIMQAEKVAARKARDHEMYNSAGLLMLAGLVDRTTGKPTRDRGELLGALLAVADVKPDDERLKDWKLDGDEMLVKKM